MNGRRYRTILVLSVFSALMSGPPGVCLADFLATSPRNPGPPLNSAYSDGTPCLTPDGLTIYFTSNRPGGSGAHDIWMSTRPSRTDNWSQPTNLGAQVNSGALDYFPNISGDALTLMFYSTRSGGGDIWTSKRTATDTPWTGASKLAFGVNSNSEDVSPNMSPDGLTLLLSSNRPGGFGDYDIYVATRSSLEAPWSSPVNLGSPINTSALEAAPFLSADGLTLLFHSLRAGGSGSYDLYYSRRKTTESPWSTPVNAGAPVNSSYVELGPTLSGDGCLLYFSEHFMYPLRPGGYGADDLWEVCFIPVVDMDGDSQVNILDFAYFAQSWEQGNILCDMAPGPFGDGAIDHRDLAVLAGCYCQAGPPNPAHSPMPADGAAGVTATTALSWTSGLYAEIHEVHFGTDNPPPLLGTELGTVFDPGVLAYETTYYWRVDEINNEGVSTGTVWRFTTERKPR